MELDLSVQQDKRLKTGLSRNCTCMRGGLFTFASRRLFLRREQVIL